MTEQLSAQEIERYSRQLILPGWSAAAQRELGLCSVLTSFGSAARYLAAAGLGRVVLTREAARDLVPFRAELEALNPHCRIEDGSPESAGSVECVILDQPPAELACARIVLVVDQHSVTRLLPEGGVELRFQLCPSISGNNADEARFIRGACAALALLQLLAFRNGQ